MSDVIGAYELLDRVPDLGEAPRWRGRSQLQGRAVALNQFPGNSVASVDRLRADVRSLAALSHPNLVTVLDVVEADGQIWLVEEWVDGVPLEALLTGGGWLTAQQSLGVIRGMLKGLAFVHHNGILHRNVSPRAVLLKPDGTAALTDFGMIAVPGAGRNPFLSPEAANGMGLSTRSDVCSAAAVLAMLLGDAADAYIRPVLAKAMSVDPTLRHADGEELLEALEDEAERGYGETWLSDSSVTGLLAGVGTSAES